MATIVSMDTATQVCTVALSKDGKLVALRELNEKNIHAEVLTAFVQEVVEEAKLELKEVDAFAVSKGPGSYTGLRIGVSTAKGLCYSLDKPLISVGTLDSLANWAALQLKDQITPHHLFNPMIDARRMEVYTAQYNSKVEMLDEVAPLILDETAFANLKEEQTLILVGDGCAKTQELFKDRKNIKIYPEILCSSQGMISIAEEKFQKQDFEDVAYFEPFYLKEFVAGIPRVKGLR